MKPTALVCCVDAQVLLTRSLLLESRGFAVTCVSSMHALETLSTKTSFDLAIFGNGFSEEEVREFVRIVCGRWPDTRILILNSNGESILDLPSCEQFHSLYRPQAMLAKAQEMVRVSACA